MPGRGTSCYTVRLSLAENDELKELWLQCAYRRSESLDPRQEKPGESVSSLEPLENTTILYPETNEMCANEALWRSGRRWDLSLLLNKFWRLCGSRIHYFLRNYTRLFKGTLVLSSATTGWRNLSRSFCLCLKRSQEEGTQLWLPEPSAVCPLAFQFPIRKSAQCMVLPRNCCNSCARPDTSVKYLRTNPKCRPLFQKRAEFKDGCNKPRTL